MTADNIYQEMFTAKDDNFHSVECSSCETASEPQNYQPDGYSTEDDEAQIYWNLQPQYEDATYEDVMYEDVTYEDDTFEDAKYEDATYEDATYENAMYEQAENENTTYEHAEEKGATYEQAEEEIATYDQAEEEGATYQQAEEDIATYEQAEEEVATYEQVQKENAIYDQLEFDDEEDEEDEEDEVLHDVRILPSLGSVKHSTGECSPCTFYHRKTGCMNGYDCAFCHYRHEEKRRSRACKVKRERLRKNWELILHTLGDNLALLLDNPSLSVDELGLTHVLLPSVRADPALIERLVNRLANYAKKIYGPKHGSNYDGNNYDGQYNGNSYIGNNYNEYDDYGEYDEYDDYAYSHDMVWNSSPYVPGAHQYTNMDQHNGETVCFWSL